MAGSVNKVILIGNLGKDPEIRRTQDGRPIANLRVATTETWRDKTSGERREKTEWHSVVIFNEGLCRVAEQYLKKGAKVYIEGALQTRKWQGQDGQDRYSHRGGAAGLQQRADHARLARRGRRCRRPGRHAGGRPGGLLRAPSNGTRQAGRARRRQGLRQAGRRRDPVLTRLAGAASVGLMLISLT